MSGTSSPPLSTVCIMNQAVFGIRSSEMSKLWSLPSRKIACTSQKEIKFYQRHRILSEVVIHEQPILGIRQVWKYMRACILSRFNSVWLFATPWTVAHQTPLSVEFSRQEYWRGLPFLPPGDLPNPGVEPVSCVSLALAGGFFTPSTIWETPGRSAPVSNLRRQDDKTRNNFRLL